MAFLARYPGQDAGSGDSIQYDEVLLKLAKRLPNDDPMVAQVKQLFNQSRDVIEAWLEEDEREGKARGNQGQLADLVAALDDWVCGIRDWSEVEQRLEDVRGIAREIHLG
jgi:hypothetical protein